MSDVQDESESTKDVIIRRCKQHRKDLDATLQSVKDTMVLIGREAGGAEATLSMRSIQLGVMWLGMVLKEVAPGNNPYPNSYKPENTIVEPTADGLKL